MTKPISRRRLLFMSEAAPAPSPAPPDKPFSLGDFYAKRSAQPAPMPAFVVRVPDVPVETTSVGVARAAAAPWNLRAPERSANAARLGGPVAVVRSSCLAWNGSPCWTCSERCPVDSAIVLDAGRPVIDQQRCDGCGECVAACPAPLNALKLAAHQSPSS